MIVNKTSLGFNIIYHEAHGLLAGKIAYHIKRELRSTYFFELLIAATEHDDRQLNLSQKQYLSKNGIPMDFTETPIKILDIVSRMKRVINEVKNKSSWIRLMVSYHLEFLYLNMASKSKRINQFFEEEFKQRDHILRLYNSTEKKARAEYETIRFCDRLSLILCGDEVPTQGRSLEINKSINNTAYFIKLKDNGDLTIAPWPFEEDQFTLSVEERQIMETHFNSQLDFKEKLTTSIPVLKTWQFSK